MITIYVLIGFAILFVAICVAFFVIDKVQTNIAYRNLLYLNENGESLKADRPEEYYKIADKIVNNLCGRYKYLEVKKSKHGLGWFVKGKERTEEYCCFDDLSSEPVWVYKKNCYFPNDENNEVKNRPTRYLDIKEEAIKLRHKVLDVILEDLMNTYLVKAKNRILSE